MAKIETYPLETEVVSDDMVIGTSSSDSNKTKNFKVSDLASYLMGLVTSYIISLNLNSFKWRGLFTNSSTITPAAGVATPLDVPITDTGVSSGVSIVTNGSTMSRITFAHSGVYRIFVSMQVKNNGLIEETLTIWLSKNGEADINSISGSAKVYSLGARLAITANAEYFVSVTQGDFISPMFMCSGVTPITATPAGNNLPSRNSASVSVNSI